MAQQHQSCWTPICKGDNYENSNVISGWSGGLHNNRVVTAEDILINDKGGYQFRLIVDGVETEENPILHDWDFGVPLYKWDGEKVQRRTAEEIEAEREKLYADFVKAEAERIANAPETILMETALDVEARLALLEMGVTV